MNILKYILLKKIKFLRQNSKKIFSKIRKSILERTNVQKYILERTNVQKYILERTNVQNYANVRERS